MKGQPKMFETNGITDIHKSTMTETDSNNTYQGGAGFSALLPNDRELSQYPHLYEEVVSLENVGSFIVRAIKHSDTPLFKALFATLSPRSIYMRFFSSLKQLSDDMLARLTQIDYNKQIALAAVQAHEHQVKMIGVARVIETVNAQHAEFAVLVSDSLQGKGIGACLLMRCLAIARLRDIKTIYGLVLAENTQMLALARKFNFKVRRVPQSSEYELTINL